MADALNNQLKIAARKYIFEGKTKKESLTIAGYSPSYIKKNSRNLFRSAAMESYIDELERRREEEMAEMWRTMAQDAPAIYRKYKKLAEDTTSDDVKRKIYFDILNRTGYISANKLEITSKKGSIEDLDADIAKLELQLDQEGYGKPKKDDISE